MSSIIWWIVVLAILAALVAAGAVVLKAYLNGETPASVLFRPRTTPRLAVIEHASVDGKRKLVLVRRDDVEHLIMTGGPVDVVIETGIVPEQPAEIPRSLDAYREPVTPPLTQPVFTRPARTFGQAQPPASQAQPSAVEEMELALKR